MAGTNARFGRGSPLSSQPDAPRAQTLVTRKPKQQSAGCPNSGWWSRGNCRTYINSFEETKSPSAAGKSVETQLRQAIFDFFCQSGIETCQFERCEVFRKACRSALPDCEWKEFRDWVVNWIACWMQSQNQSVSLSHCHPSMISGFLTHLAQSRDRIRTDSIPFSPITFHSILTKVHQEGSIGRSETERIIDIMGIFDWLSLWLAEYEPWPDTNNPAETLPELGHISRDRNISNDLIEIHKRDRANALLRRVEERQGNWRGVCPTSLWNLAVSQGDQYVATLAIVDYLKSDQQPFPQALRTHAECTQQFCTHAYEDTAKIFQLHKCRAGSCPTVDVPIQKLIDVFENAGPGEWKPTAWDISSWDPNAPAGKDRVFDKLLTDPDAKYMAVSHVWSDGTGVGQHKQGTVNSCLVDFWVSAAKEAGCRGIWWDTICLPINPQARRKALNVMLDNFGNAAVFLIHDQELAKTPWASKTPQNAAIAIVLSSWFTRGWTAAELSAAGREVLVVLRSRDPNDFGPLIVDLRELRLEGTDSLARMPLPSLAHLGAISMLDGIHPCPFGDSAVRSTRTNSFSGILPILRSRSTAWEKDRILIASLMHSRLSDIHFKVDATTSIPEMTRRLLTSMGEIPRTAILHGEAPMKAQGGWSWCPPSIFELGTSSYPLSHQDNTLLPKIYVPQSGVAHGWFYAMPVRREDVDGLLPYGSHPMVVARVRTTLEKPEECLVLKLGNPNAKMMPGILVIPVSVTPGRGRQLGMECRYIGCVYSVRPERAASRQPIVLGLIGAEAKIYTYADTEADPYARAYAQDSALKRLNAEQVLRQLVEKGHTYNTPAEVHKNKLVTGHY